MKCDIVLAGVGGQGLLSIAMLIGRTALDQGLRVKQAEVHGMAQRGGAVHSHLRLSDRPIASDLIAVGTANVLLAMEPLEALRHLPMLADDGVVFSNTTTIRNIPDYPDEEVLRQQLASRAAIKWIDAERLAQEAGSLRTANVVLLGALSQALPMEQRIFERAIRTMFSRKGDTVVEQNLRAFAHGRSAVREESAP
ncbi:indolepyruvate oxidoreductase subunit beta [Candidatus Bipolaricaulota bacterium]|nr:indolepyruvate oxidoreductase subunit beta [Candidatus Bipolaricaulota bacterium]